MDIAKKIICCLLFALMFQDASARWRGNDLIELKAGFFMPSDENYDAKSPFAESLKETYDTFLLNNLILNLTYGRYIKKDLFVDFNVGYAGVKNSSESDDEVIVRLIPLSLSINKILGIVRSVQYTIGAGFDYLLMSGEVNGKDYSNEIGGYHVKAGLRCFIFTSELKYSVIDRFGKNDRNMGGLTLSAGLAFQFFLF